jgi:hypothetical protein
MHVAALVAIAVALMGAVAYPSTTFHCLGAFFCRDTTLHRVPLRVAILLLGIGAACILELIGRGSLPAQPYAGAITAVALGAFVPLWLWSRDGSCLHREVTALRCQAGLGIVVPLSGLVLALGLIRMGQASASPFAQRSGCRRNTAEGLRRKRRSREVPFRPASERET